MRRSTTSTAPPIAASASRWIDSMTANATLTSRSRREGDSLRWLVYTAAACSFCCSVFRIRVAAAEHIDRVRVRLIAVEPVIGNHAARDDDHRPPPERRHAGDARRPRRARLEIPGLHGHPDVRVEHPRVEPGEHEQDQLEPEEDVV